MRPSRWLTGPPTLTPREVAEMALAGVVHPWLEAERLRLTARLRTEGHAWSYRRKVIVRAMAWTLRRAARVREA